MAERYRRGKLFRARAGEVIAWKAAYGFRRIPRTGNAPAHLEIYEPEAAIVRRIFTERAAGTTIREIARRLSAGGVPAPGGRGCWNTSSLCRILRCETYIGRVYFNRTVTVPAARPGGRPSQAQRPREEWITIACPRIIPDELFEAAGKISYDNSQWSPRRADPGAWLLRGMVKCGRCGVGCNCQKMRGGNGTWHRYYYCRNHDPMQAGGRDRRCTERNIRADALDEFVFGQIRSALLDPAQLLAGEQAAAVAAPAPDDELLAAELTRLDRKLHAAKAEHDRLIDCYQAGLIVMPELRRRATAITTRQRELQDKRTSLAGQRAELARGNRLRESIENFAQQIRAVIDKLDHDQRQRLLRLLIEDVQVTGWHVKIRLRIPLDGPPGGNPGRLPPPRPSPDDGGTGSAPPVSTEDRLRSLHGDPRTTMRQGGRAGPRQPGPARHVCRRVHRGRSSVTRTGRQFHLAACGRAAWRPGRAMHHHGHAAVTGHSVKGVPEPLVGAAPRPQFRQAGGQQIRMFCAPAGWCGWPRLTARSVAPVPAGACWCSGCAEPVTAAAACAGPAAGGR